MKLSGLTRESVFEAIKLIDQKKLSAKQLNSDYRVPVDGRIYPFKLLVEHSYRISTGNSLSEGTFKEYFYLIRQFEEFTGFKVKVTASILFRKKMGINFYIINSPHVLIGKAGAESVDLSVLGPSVNDREIQKLGFVTIWG